MRAAGAEDDIRADQAGEEHHLVARKSHMATLPGVTGAWRTRVGAWPAPWRGPVAVELWVATAIVVTTLGA